MKLHLPKSLLTAVLAVGMALPIVYAEDSGTTVKSSTDFTYAGTVYTMSPTALNNTLADLYESRIVPAAGETPASWDVDEAKSTLSWDKLYGNTTENGNNPYNTLRLTADTDYTYTFQPLTAAGFIVETTADGASFKANTGSGGLREIRIGLVDDDVTSTSYFAGSFTINNQNAADTGSHIYMQGKQEWYIADGKQVEFQVKNKSYIQNSGTWNVTGSGTLAINTTINNTDGTFNMATGTTLHVTNLAGLDSTWDVGTSGLTENGSTQLAKTYTVIKGGTSNVSSITYTSGDSTVSQNLTNNSYFAQTWDAYGVVTDTSVESIKDITEGIVSIKKGATLSRDGQSFTNAKQLAGEGTYDMGNLGKGTWSTLTNNVSLHESWTGTITVAGGEFSIDSGNNNTNNGKSVQAINFDSLGNANSTVEIAKGGLYGYLDGPGDQTTTFNTNIKLTGDLTIQNANSKTTHVFAGKISGEGDIVLARTGGSPCALTFSNDISDWTGSLLNTRNKKNNEVYTTNINLNGQATEVNATINALAKLTDSDGNEVTSEGNYLNIYVRNEGKTTTFNEDVTVSMFNASSAVALGEGVKLTLTADNRNEVSNISNLTADDAGNTIELKQGATLKRIASKNGGTVTLTGAGTYDMRGNYASNVAGLDQANWTGKVVVAGSKNEFNLNNYGNAKSTIEIGTYTTGAGESAVTTNGYTGYLDDGSRTYDANLILTGDMTLTNGWGGQTKTFAGTITGSGDFISAYNGGTGTVTFAQNWKFSGDISGWDGNFTVQDVTSKTLYGTVAFTGTSEINLVSITKSSTGTLDVTISDADQGETKSAVAVGSSITATSLTVNAAEGVELNNTVTVNTLDVQGTTKVTGDGNVTVNNTLTIDSAGALDMTGALVLTGASVDLSGFTVDTTTAQNTYTYTLAFAEGGITANETINFTGLTGIEGYTATLAAMAGDPASGVALMSDTNKYLVLTLTSNNPVIPEPETTLTTLTINGGTYDATAGVLTFTTLENATGAVFGDTLNATMTDAKWDEILAAISTTLPDEVKVSFEGADDVLFDFNNGSTIQTITINGEGTKGEQVLSGEGAHDGTIVGNYVMAYIPEPTTTTLSLLALAGLAVRRRRK